MQKKGRDPLRITTLKRKKYNATFSNLTERKVRLIIAAFNANKNVAYCRGIFNISDNG
jgi:hypothetical protein